MGLTKDLEKACVEGLGPQAQDAGRCPEVAKLQADAIEKFLKAQDFTITQMKAILQLEELRTQTFLTADINPTAQYITAAGAPAPLIGSSKGVKIPALNLKKGGGDSVKPSQGGLLITKGYAYIGRNPVSANETNESNTLVKLKQTKSGTK
tara:strand:- start:2948 stop:3400 length:453 start_codon:yes stop_codon:yes gene_type:complete